MIVKITGYGSGDENFVDYTVSGLDEKQKNYILKNLNEKIKVNGDDLIITLYFTPKLYPFQSETAQFRLNDFISREEIEMNVFLSGFLDDI